jgi:hypothetical protein
LPFERCDHLLHFKAVRQRGVKCLLYQCAFMQAKHAVAGQALEMGMMIVLARLIASVKAETEYSIIPRHFMRQTLLYQPFQYPIQSDAVWQLAISPALLQQFFCNIVVRQRGRGATLSMAGLQQGRQDLHARRSNTSPGSAQ